MPDKGLGELGRLTRGERLLIKRRREGWSQGDAARRHNTTHSMYGKWERDVVKGGPFIQFYKLEPHERCLLYRRRAEQTQDQVATALECCRWWVNQMERGAVSCDDLLWYWEQ